MATLRASTIKSRGAIGLLLLVAMAGFYLAPKIHAVLSPSTSLAKATLSSEVQLLTAGPIETAYADVSIEYHDTMHENETVLVSLECKMISRVVNVQQGVVVDRQEEAMGTIPIDLAVKLFSSGFDVLPSDAYKFERDTDLPIKCTWTITPKREGEHTCLLNYEEKMNFYQRRVRVPTLTINGKEIKADPNGNYALPIRVTTLYGIPQFWVSVLTMVGSLFALAMGWDWVSDHIKKRFGPKAEKEEPPSPPKIILTE